MQNFSMKCFRSFQIFGAKSALLFLVLAAILIIIPAKAQDNSASDTARFEISRAAVIDLARIIRESEATARVRVLLDGKSAEFQQEFAEKETQLLAKEKELKAKESLITEDAYQEKVRAFQRDVAAIQQDIQNKRQSLDRALQEAQDKIRSLATTIIAEYASEYKIDLVVKEELLLVFRNQLNITDDILQILNERTKDAQLEISEQTTATGE